MKPLIVSVILQCMKNKSLLILVKKYLERYLKEQLNIEYINLTIKLIKFYLVVTFKIVGHINDMDNKNTKTY